ncbi:hypothetical protein EV401DRAFT_1998522 [Pisolithus croceorrhizus]|nr:hypothetical protein EV401DRAFT_1998522 [Pisolithus croceorrhizus]
MPNVKCRYYTEDGEPKQGGCRRHGAGNCPFVHPDSSAWATAATASSKPGSSKGGGRGGGGPGHAQGTRKGGSGSGLFSSMHDPSGNAASSSGWGNLADANLGSSNGGWDTGGGGGWDTGNESGWGAGGGGKLDTGGDWKMSDSSGGDAVKPSSGSPLRQGWGSTVGWDSVESSKPGESEETSTAWWNSVDTGSWGRGSTNTNAKQDKGKGNEDWPPKQNDTSTKAREAPIFHGTVWADDQPGGQNLSRNSGSTGTDSRKTKLPPHSSDMDAGMDPPPKLTSTNQVLLGTKRKWGSDAIPPKDTDMEDLTTTATTDHPKIPNVPLPPPLKTQPSPITDPGDTPLTPAAPALVPPRPKRKREGLDERRETFKEYIKTWERAVRAKFHLAEAELNRDRWYRTRKSPCYARIGDAGIDILESKRAEFDREYFAQREKLSLAVNALVDYQETVMSGCDLVQRFDISEETNRFVAESTAYARQIRTLIEDFKNRDVPMRDPSPSPSARVSPPPTDEWEALQRRVEEMEESLEQIDAELTLSRPMDIRDMVDKVFDARVSELREARKQEVQKMATQVRPEVVIPPDSLEKLEESAERWREVEERLPKTIEDISGLIVGNAQFASRLEQLEKENAGHREVLAKLQDRYAATEDLLRQKEKLREDLDELMHRPHFGPCVPAEDTCRQLIEELKPALGALVQKIYEQEIAPAVRTMGEAVAGVPNCKQTELSRPQENSHNPPQN